MPAMASLAWSLETFGGMEVKSPPPAVLSVLPPGVSAASVGASSRGDLTEAAHCRSAAVTFGSYEAHLAACTRKFPRVGFPCSWGFRAEACSRLVRRGSLCCRL